MLPSLWRSAWHIRCTWYAGGRRWRPLDVGCGLSKKEQQRSSKGGANENRGAAREQQMRSTYEQQMSSNKKQGSSKGAANEKQTRSKQQNKTERMLGGCVWGEDFDARTRLAPSFRMVVSPSGNSVAVRCRKWTKTCQITKPVNTRA